PRGGAAVRAGPAHLAARRRHARRAQILYHVRRATRFPGRQGGVDSVLDLRLRGLLQVPQALGAVAMEAIVIAAGRGSRLWERTQQVPKTLLPFGDGTILSQILGNLRDAGARRVRIVVGFRGDEIQRHVERLAAIRDLVSFVPKPEGGTGEAHSGLAGGGRRGAGARRLAT